MEWRCILFGRGLQLLVCACCECVLWDDYLLFFLFLVACPCVLFVYIEIKQQNSSAFDFLPVFVHLFRKKINI